MGISYAGFPLILTPPTSGMAEYVEQYLEYEGRRLFSWNSSYRTSGWWHSKAANVSRVNMPIRRSHPPTNSTIPAMPSNEESGAAPELIVG